MATTEYDCRTAPYNALRNVSRARGSIDMETAQLVLTDAMQKEGIEVEPFTKTCTGMLERAIKFLESAGDLVKIAKGRYKAVTWSPIEESAEYELSSTGKLRHIATGKILASREDSRGRELAKLHGRTVDIAKLTPIAAAA